MDISKEIDSICKKYKELRLKKIQVFRLIKLVKDPLLWLQLLAKDVVTCTTHFGDNAKDDVAVHRKALEQRLDLLSRTLGDPETTSAFKNATEIDDIRKVVFSNWLNTTISSCVYTDACRSNTPCSDVFNYSLKGVITELRGTQEGRLLEGYVTSYTSEDQPASYGYRFDSTSPAEVDPQFGAYPLHIGDEVTFSPAPGQYMASDQNVVPGTLLVSKYNTHLKDSFITRYFNWILKNDTAESKPLECLTKLVDSSLPIWVCVLDDKEETHSRFFNEVLKVCNICITAPELIIAPKEKHQVLVTFSDSCFVQNVARLLSLEKEDDLSLLIVVELLCALVRANVDKCILAKPLRDMTQLLDTKNRTDLLKPLMLSLLDSQFTPAVSPMTMIQGAWQSISIIPSSDEVQAIVKKFTESKSPKFDLPEVKLTYSSAVEYGHTYFSLLRADCYYPLCEKIAGFKAGKGISKGCYRLRLTGLISVAPRPVLFGFSFECLHHNDEGDDTPYLKKGNLLCISKDGTFGRELIWATIEDTCRVSYEEQEDNVIKKVSDRDVTQKNDMFTLVGISYSGFYFLGTAKRLYKMIICTRDWSIHSRVIKH